MKDGATVFSFCLKKIKTKFQKPIDKLVTM